MLSYLGNTLLSFFRFTQLNILLKYLVEYFYLRSSFLQSVLSFRIWDQLCCSTSEDEELQIYIYEIAASCGLLVTSSVTTTEDGYILGLCRLAVPSSDSNASETEEDDEEENAEQFSHHESANHNRKGLPILFIHGLMQDCESFLCSGKNDSIASVLAHAGYDVWLGNNRGNRYSPMHVDHSPQSHEYWNFSIDHLAQFDVPAMVRHICQATGYDKIAIVGFSQGSAQTFLGLSSSVYLQEHVSLFIALSPPLQLTGFSDTYLTALVHRHPYLITALFGHKAMLMQVLMWKNILSRTAFAGTVSASMKFLFNWSCDNIAESRRLNLFQHVFSPSSVHCVLHWFQIMKHNKLRRYKAANSHKSGVVYNTMRALVSLLLAGCSAYWHFWWSCVLVPVWRMLLGVVATILPGGCLITDSNDSTINSKTNHVASMDDLGGDTSSSFPAGNDAYDLRDVNCAVAVIAGGADGLIDTTNIPKLIPNCIFCHIEPKFEHLDVIWADSARKVIFPKLLALLETHTTTLSAQQHKKGL